MIAVASDRDGFRKTRRIRHQIGEAAFERPRDTVMPRRVSDAGRVPPCRAQTRNPSSRSCASSSRTLSARRPPAPRRPHRRRRSARAKSHVRLAEALGGVGQPQDRFDLVRRKPIATASKTSEVRSSTIGKSQNSTHRRAAPREHPHHRIVELDAISTRVDLPTVSIQNGGRSACAVLPTGTDRAAKRTVSGRRRHVGRR